MYINYGSCGVSFMMFLEHSGNMLDHQKCALPDRLVRRHVSQAHSVGQTHPTLVHHVFVLLEKREDAVLILKAYSFCGID